MAWPTEFPRSTRALPLIWMWWYVWPCGAGAEGIDIEVDVQIASGPVHLRQLLRVLPTISALSSRTASCYYLNLLGLLQIIIAVSLTLCLRYIGVATCACGVHNNYSLSLVHSRQNQTDSFHHQKAHQNYRHRRLSLSTIYKP